MEVLLVGIVGPIDLVNRIMDQMNIENELNIEYKLFIIKHVEETRNIEQDLLFECDILLFAGQMAYEIYMSSQLINYVGPIPICVHYDGSAIYKTLFELAIENAGQLFQFTPFTIDVLSKLEVLNSISEIGLEDHSFIPLQNEVTYTTKDWADQHESNFMNGSSKCAITCLTSVAKELEHRGIPVKRVKATHASIKSAISILNANIAALLNTELQTTAILIQWHKTDRRPQNKYQYFRTKIAFEEIIIDFCEENQMSLTFINDTQVNIYTNKQMAKNLTDRFKRFPLLNKLEEQIGSNISVGIGIGDDTSKAEIHAEKALKFSNTKKKSCCYICSEYGELTGPLLINDTPPLSFSTKLKEEHLIEISNTTNLSAVTITRLVSLLEHSSTKELTVHHLAEAFDISLRAASRILKTLEQYNFAMITGEEQPPGRGRPRKVYKIQI
ncbi:hypothetical protein JFL43_09525 [Viridibacillus sp. YIM B01967]|uniref:Transcriptional regulator n=1 Tax=Viridibacillus soli TaxID=2798301 RepID=A0ABS1H6R5_9BACL|nr:hypothetical protein [Viridibacillus soli]MBK3495091.1 hypothetical protein [Viridibacillus soli]